MRRAGSSRTRPISIGPSARGGGRGGAPQDGADPRDHLASAERLDDVVVGAELEADDAVGLLPARREDDDRHARRRPQLAADVEPGAVRQPDVEQDEIGPHRPALRERVGDRVRDLGVEAVALERLGERRGDRLLVLHQQDRPLRLAMRVDSALRARAEAPRWGAATVVAVD